MAIKLSRKSVKELIEEARLLTKKERYLCAKELLKYIDLDYLIPLTDDLERITTLKVEEEDVTAIEVDYRRQPYRSTKTGSKIYHIYAWLVRWSGQPMNGYLGAAYFLPNVKYAITFKETNERKVLVGLGFIRVETQLFLKVLYLEPERYVEQYLYYDTALPIPEYPRDLFKKELIDRIDIECLEILSGDFAEAAAQQLKPQIAEAVKLAIADGRATTKSSETAKSSENVKPSPRAIATARKKVSVKAKEKESQPTEKSNNKTYQKPGNGYPFKTKKIKISRQAEDRLLRRMGDWVELSRNLSTNYQLQIQKKDALILLNHEGRNIISYDARLKELSVPHTNSLYKLLGSIASLVLKSETSSEIKQKARLYLEWLNSAPTGRDEKLLFLFQG